MCRLYLSFQIYAKESRCKCNKCPTAVVAIEGEGWKGEKNFKWYELSSKAAGEGSTAGDIMNIGKVLF